MKISRKLQLIFYSLFTILTFHKYYICDDCYHIHKFVNNEFASCGGRYKSYIFVNVDCANKTIKKAYNMLKEAIAK